MLDSSVLTRLVLTWQSIPHLTYEVTDWDAIPKIQLLILLYLRLEYLYTKFLLHKLLTKHGGDRSPMVETAHELLDLVLLRARQREVVMAHRIDIEWTVSPMLPTCDPVNLSCINASSGRFLCHAEC